MTWSFRPRWAHLLILGNLALFVFLFVQIPRLTRVRLVFQPRVPTDLSTGPVSAATEPQREISVLEIGNLLDGGSKSNLIDSQQIRLPSATVLPDGLQFHFSDPLFSLGAQRIVAFGTDDPLALDLTVQEADESSGSQPRAIRPWRDCAQRGGPVKLHVDGAVRAGRNQTLIVDTTPVWFLVPDASWDAYVSDRCGVSYAGSTRGHRMFPTRLFEDSKPPRGGVDLSYEIEDELTGAPLPANVSATVTARVVDDVDISRFHLTCGPLTGKIDASCFQRYSALPAGRCAQIWPVTVDRDRSVIHISRAAGSSPGCSFVIDVAPTDRNGPGQVTVLELFDTPREAP
jgi:hypothetical protein